MHDSRFDRWSPRLAATLMLIGHVRHLATTAGQTVTGCVLRAWEATHGAFGPAVACLMGSAVVLGAQVSVRAPQPGRIGHMLFDNRLGALVFIESSRETGTERLWRMQGTDWALLNGAGPRARELEAAVYDTARQRLVMHGGMVADGGDTSLGELWEFDGTAWSQPETQGPGARDHHAMAYDPNRRRTILFGGRMTRDRLGTDTWEYDGSAWRRFDVVGPGGRAHFAMTYDTVHRRVLIFGGMDQQSRAHNDLWAWDGRAWTKVSEGGPPARTHHRMAFDRRRGTLVLFGGQLGTSAFGDTWTWDGTRWTEAMALPSGPVKRGGHVMAYDPTRERVLLFGGGYFDGRISHQHQDLWAWNGRAWDRVDGVPR